MLLAHEWCLDTNFQSTLLILLLIIFFYAASIYVRVAEDRMDLLRAAIVGPKGTPYHDGLFFFDVHFPSSYPSGPPVCTDSFYYFFLVSISLHIFFPIWIIECLSFMVLQLVHYHSGGLRINPNLYDCGKVCLSLLGTWSGHGCEKWNPAQSTMLQVLVSIQALILNDKPYFNEPGYEASANTLHGQTRATDYNDNTFILSCKTMLYSLRRPPEVYYLLMQQYLWEVWLFLLWTLTIFCLWLLAALCRPCCWALPHTRAHHPRSMQVLPWG